MAEVQPISYLDGNGKVHIILAACDICGDRLNMLSGRGMWVHELAWQQFLSFSRISSRGPDKGLCILYPARWIPYCYSCLYMSTVGGD